MVGWRRNGVGGKNVSTGQIFGCASNESGRRCVRKNSREGGWKIRMTARRDNSRSPGRAFPGRCDISVSIARLTRRVGSQLRMGVALDSHHLRFRMRKASLKNKIISPSLKRDISLGRRSCCLSDNLPSFVEMTATFALSTHPELVVRRSRAVEFYQGPIQRTAGESSHSVVRDSFCLTVVG